MGHPIIGGWEYVRAAYLIVWIVWGLYGFSLWRRHRLVKERERI